MHTTSDATDARASWPFYVACRAALPRYRALGAPELPVRRISSRTVAIWCPWCEAEHRHWAESWGMPCHRWAHCTDPASPLKTTGYILTEPGAEVAA